MIDKLESLPPCAKYNYDYVVLQATDNSIPFYESMGFVRIGCIVKDEVRMDGPMRSVAMIVDRSQLQDEGIDDKISPGLRDIFGVERYLRG